MYRTFKKLSMALVLLLVLFTTAAGQGSGVAYAAQQSEGTPAVPLAPDYTWNDLGQTTRSITLNIKGDSIKLSGATFQAAESFGTELPQDILSFYSNEQLFNDGWVSDNSFETPEGLHQIFYHESGVYLAVDFVACADDASAKCVTVWESEQADTATLVPGPAMPESAVEPNATTWGKTAPVDGATINTPTSVTLSWGSYSPTPDKYSYCIKQGSECADNDPNWTGNLTNTSVNLSLSSGVKYYWQVKAITCASCSPKKFVLANSGVWWTFTTTSNVISGNTGVAGVTLTYYDSGTKTVTSDASANYSIRPTYNWSGTVTPSKTGYSFSPANRAYSNLKSDQTSQNYTAIPSMLTLTGNAGAGTILSYVDGTLKTVTADGSGNYVISVPYAWSGTVTPIKSCTNFTPSSRAYPSITSNQVAQDYSGNSFSTMTVSGHTNVVSATIDYTGGSTVSDAATGNYSISLACPWSGTITPSKPGYIFTPFSRVYTNLGNNRGVQDFSAISAVSISGNAGVGATIAYTYAGITRSVATDGSGNYSLQVPTGWSGVLTPSKAVTIFSPHYLPLSNVASDLSGQNFAQASGFSISGNAGVADATLSFFDGLLQTVTADSAGNYSLVVSSAWAGDVTPSKPGYIFAPTKITYPAVGSNLINQNYTVGLTVTFSDVPTSFWAWQNIEALFKNSVTTGCAVSPLRFCPNNIVTRAEMAVFLVRTKYGASYVPPAAAGIFSDVPTSFWAAAWIEKLAADGITLGCAAGKYCPLNPVTRDQMAAFLLRTRYGSAYAPPAAAGVFIDVPSSHWASTWIEQLYADGITNGCGTGRYCPSTGVSRAEMAAFIIRAFGLK